MAYGSVNVPGGSDCVYVTAGKKAGTTLGEKATAEGKDTTASGTNSHAEGFNTVASGAYSHAEGYNYTDSRERGGAAGQCSHVEGISTEATGNFSHAEGYMTSASGVHSHAECHASHAIGKSSHAEGCGTKAIGEYSHAEGYITTADNAYSHAEGYETTASGKSSHAEGEACIARGCGGHSEGISTFSDGLMGGSHAEGDGTAAVPTLCCFPLMPNSTTGYVTAYKASMDADTLVEWFSKITVGMTIYVGSRSDSNTGSLDKRKITAVDTSSCKITLDKSLPSGKRVFCVIPEIGDYSSGFFSAHAEGHATIAIRSCAHAEGKETVASGENSHTEGRYTMAKGANSHAEGDASKSIGDGSHAEGASTKAEGAASHAEGRLTEATGNFSHAGGAYTTAANEASYAGGQYNQAMRSDDLFVLGYGTESLARKNVFRVTNKGAVYGLSAFNSTGADYAEFFEWQDGNPNSEERAGRFVTLDGEKIRFATSEDDFILGIVSGNPSVIGDAFEDQWNGQYEVDIFGRPIYEELTIPSELDRDGNVIVPERTQIHQKLSPNYDNTQTYIPRSQRKEWATVGMMGKLTVIDDGTCQINGYCTAGENGVATAADKPTKYRVMSRLDECHVRVLVL